jgi:hypothetical protein
MVSLGTAVPAGQGCVNAARGDATRRQSGRGTSVGTASGRRYTMAFSPRFRVSHCRALCSDRAIAARIDRFRPSLAVAQTAHDQAKLEIVASPLDG